MSLRQGSRFDLTYTTSRNFFTMTKLTLGVLTVLGVSTIACGGNNASMSAPSATTSVTAQHLAALPVPVVMSVSTGHVAAAKDDSRSEIEGTISAIVATPPSIVVNGSTVSVPSTAVIRHGQTTLAFAGLKIGDRVHVKASMSGTLLVATEVIVQNEQPAPDHVTISGTVSALSGTCPKVTFTANGTKVSTDVTTTFGDGTCAELANGVTVHVKGVRQTDGTVLANRVFFEDNDVEGAHVTGKVSARGGTCPTLTLMVNTRTISTTATTTFVGGTCSDVVNGARVTVRGTTQPDGSIVATRVRLNSNEANEDN